MGKNKKEFKIEWRRDGQKYYYIFGVTNPTEVFSSFEKLMYERAGSVTFIDGLKMRHPELVARANQIANQTKRGYIIEYHGKKLDVSEAIEHYGYMFDPDAMERNDPAEIEKLGKFQTWINEFRDNYEKNKQELESLKSAEKEKAEKRRMWVDQVIPKGMKRWNDVVYDEKNDIYIVYNKFFTTDPFYHNTKTTLKWKHLYGDDAVIITPKSVIDGSKVVEFHHGYPALRMNGPENPIWFILPTITEEMLTDEMIRDRLHYVDKGRPIIDYETEEPRIYVRESGNMSLTEREVEYKDSHPPFGPKDAKPLEPWHELGITLFFYKDYLKFMKENKNIGTVTQLHYVNPTPVAAPPEIKA
jgi:hypothetical protein